ncbi:MAG: hypothetical protein IKU52_02565 [Clostridia bacterium]|nr:hypothetical protein [Clostridia bacterium]
MPENLKFRRRLLISASAILLILHILYIPLMLLYSHNAGDFTKEALCNVLKITLWLISILHKSILYGVLITVFDNYSLKMSLPFTAAGIISLIISRFGELLNYTVTNANFSNRELREYIYSLIVSLCLDITVILLLFVISRFPGPKRISRVFWLALIVCALPMLVSLVQEAIFCKITVSGIMEQADYGAVALTFKEIMSIIGGFSKHIITAAFTLILMLCVNRLITTDKRRKKHENS